MDQAIDLKNDNDRFQRGIDLFNKCQFFEAHEEFEMESRRERQPIRKLYQGLIQLSAACVHIQRNNRRGAILLLNRAIPLIASFTSQAVGFNLLLLLQDIYILKTSVEQVSPTTNLTNLEMTFPNIWTA
jgi:uncharacterized protein